MELSKEMVLHMAELSRLSLSEDECEAMTAQMARMTEYMDILSQLDAGAAACGDPAQNVFRADRVAPSLERAELLCNAPVTNGETFVVPKAVE